jgi:hypothetical protein
MQAQGVKQKSAEIFPSLKAVMRNGSNDPIDSLRGSSLFLGMLAAKGGEKLECL